MLVLEKKKCITLRVFSDWGCWYQAAPLSADHSRRSLASLRGRRVAAHDGVRRMRCLNLTRDLCDIHPVTGFRTLNEITSSIVPTGTTLTPPSSGGSCNSFSHATVACLPQRNSLPSVHMRCRITACGFRRIRPWIPILIRQLARHSDAGERHAAALGHGHAPCPQSRPFGAADQQRMGCLVQRRSGQFVTTSADAALHVGFAGLVASRRQAKMRADITRPSKNGPAGRSWHGTPTPSAGRRPALS